MSSSFFSCRLVFFCFFLATHIFFCFIHLSFWVWLGRSVEILRVWAASFSRRFVIFIIIIAIVVVVSYCYYSLGNFLYTIFRILFFFHIKESTNEPLAYETSIQNIFILILALWQVFFFFFFSNVDDDYLNVSMKERKINVHLKPTNGPTDDENLNINILIGFSLVPF